MLLKLVAYSILLSMPILFQPVRADQNPARDGPTLEQLQQQIKARDALIENLSKRLDRLEKREDSVKSASPALANSSPSSASNSEPDMAEHALEWALIRERGLLLRPGSVELEPGVGYSYQSYNALRVINTGSGLALRPETIKHEALSSSLALRLGLPWELQAEMNVPYILSERQSTISGTSAQSQNASGIGDVSLALTKQLLHEKGWQPNLLGTLLWKTKTGKAEFGSDTGPAGTSSLSNNATMLGTGFNTIQGGLTAVKRQDPLVYFGTLSYSANLSGTQAGAEINPGDAVGLKFGTILAASPDTSLRFAVNLARFNESSINGTKIPGSDSLNGLLEIGGSSVVSRKTLLDISAGIGLTSTSPDFVINVSLPIRLF